MKRFRFRFDSVLKLRKSREEAALTALGAAQRAYQAELQRKSGLLRELADALARRETLGTENAAGVSIEAFRLEQNFIIGTKQRIVQADQAILRASRAVEKALRNYLATRRQTQMIEKMYEREHAEWRIAAGKREQRQLDDLVMMRQRFASGESIEAMVEGEGAVPAGQQIIANEGKSA